MLHRADTRWHGMVDATDLAQTACRHILARAGDAIARRGRFDIVLSGGNTPLPTYRLLRFAAADWSAWQVWFSDERCVSVFDTESNSLQAALAWLDHVPIPRANIHTIPGELGPREAARRYEAVLQNCDEFDLVLLGLGEDGHTASLFPGHDWGEAPIAPDTIGVVNAPKPPPERVSLSAARLSRAREVLFLVEGEAKRDAVARWRAGAAIPARAIMPASGVDVLIDAGLLPPASA